MKYIAYLTWIILSLYAVIVVYQLFNLNNSGLDETGQEMYLGFIIVLIVYMVVVLGLSFIKVKWVRILALILSLLPFLFLTPWNL